MSSDTIEYGRFQLLIDPEADTAQLLIENVNRTGEHWLTLASTGRPYTTIGYLRLQPTRPDSTMFEVVEVRPATGPLLPASDDHHPEDDLIRRWFKAGWCAGAALNRGEQEVEGAL